MHHYWRYAIVFFSLMFASVSSHAGVITTAVSVSTAPNAASGGSLPENLINQSGLSANYVSGVTDFDTFTASTTADFIGAWTAATALSTSVGNETTLEMGSWLFDLGSVQSIEGIGIWNSYGFGSVWQFELKGSVDGILYNSLTAGELFDGPRDTSAQVFSWASTDLRFVQLQMVSNYYHNTFNITPGEPGPQYLFSGTLNEVVFEASTQTATVPEPEGLMILVLGLLLFLRQRNQKGQSTLILRSCHEFKRL